MYTSFCPSALCRLFSGCLGSRLCCLLRRSDSEVLCLSSHTSSPRGKHTSTTRTLLDSLKSCSYTRIFLLCTQLSGGADSALDALSDTLADIAPAPQPAPPPAKDIVNVTNLLQEHIGSTGENIFSLCSVEKVCQSLQLS